MESPPYDIIEYLVAHGAYVEAARIATDRGELRRAIALYERVWRFVDALPLAVSLGDRGLAVRLALDAQPARARHRDRRRHHRRRRPGRRRGRLRRPRPLLRGRRAPPSARGLAARRGAVPPRQRPDRRGARARPRGRAARGGPALRAPGRAGRAATRPPPRAWRSGACSSRLGRHEEAARHLQVAARTPALRTAALRALCAPLLALGFRGRRHRGRGPAAPGSAGAAARRPRTSSRSRRPRRRPPRATRACRPSARRAPRPPSRAASSIRRLLGGGATGRVYEARRHAAGHADRAQAAPARRRARRSRAPGVPPLRARGGGGRAAAPPEHRDAPRRAAGVRACSCSS